MNRWRDLPLRRRLTLLYVGLLATLLATLGGVIYIETRNFLFTSTALRQRAQAEPVIDRWMEEVAANGPPSWAGGPPPWVDGPPPWVRPPHRTPEAEEDEDDEEPPWATYYPDWESGPPPWAPGPPPWAGPTRTETPPATPTTTEATPQGTPILPQATPAPSPAAAGPAGGNDPGSVTPRDIVEIAPLLSWELTSRDTIAAVLDQRGKIVAVGGWPAEEAPTIPLDAAHVARALAGDDDVTYAAELNGQDTLVTLIPLHPESDGAEVLGVVQLTTPLDLANEVLSRERLLLGLGVLLTLLLGALGSLWLTASALAPLRRMIGTCRSIAAGNLDERVNLPQREDEVGQLAAAFDDMAGRIEATFTAQRRFIADAAHELRTPLTGLAGSLEVLLRGARDDPATAGDLIDRMHREVTRLNRLAEQLLDLSRLDAQAVVQTQPLALPRFFEDVLPQARALGWERTIGVESGPTVTVQADSDRIQQALLHLVDNAVQHTAPGGVIRLGWRIEPATVDLWVADDGEGIAPGDLPHVFEPFYRGDRGRSRRRGGTGLGLTLVRTIAEAHGGRVSAESQPGQGSRFVISLPRTAPP